MPEGVVLIGQIGCEVDAVAEAESGEVDAGEAPVVEPVPEEDGRGQRNGMGAGDVG